MDRFALTEQHIEDASAYLPLSIKTALAQTLAEQCVEAIEQDGAPPVYRLNPLNRELSLAGVLLKHYLKIHDQNDSISVELNVKDYDCYVSGGALETDGIWSADFARFTAMLDTCIQSELVVRNDHCARLTRMVMQQTTPEAMQNALSQLETVGKEVKSFVPKATLPDDEFKAATADM